MTLQALDMEPSSPSPLPDGTSAPSSGDAVAEPMATSEAAPSASAPEPASTQSSSGGSPHTKPHAASLTSIAVKNKPAAPAKAGDLTRLFELARREAKTPSEPPPAEPALVTSLPEQISEAMPVAAAPAPAPIENSVAEVPPELAPFETASEPAPVEPVPLAAPPAAPEVALEATFPLMLAPPAEAVEDAAAHALEPVPTPVADAPVVSEPEWARAAAASEPSLSFEMTEPLKVSLVPMDEVPVGTGEPAAEETEPATPTAPAVTAEPTPQPIEMPEPPVPASVEPLAVPLVVAPVEPPPSPMDAPEPAPAMVAVAPVEPLAAPAPVVPAVRTFKDLADYWRSLRSGDDHPATESIDRELVTERWPGTLLIAYTPPSQDPRGELRPGRVTRLGSACAETQSVVDAGSHSTEWMLEVARTALVNDEPVEEQQRLATMMGVAGFRMVALPLGPARGQANAVLCTLMPCGSAPRFGKRRLWL